MQNHLSASIAVAVTPSDSAVITDNVRAIYVGVAGDVTLTSSESSTPVTFKNAPAGIILPVNVYKVMATGTTATDIVALK